MLMGKAFLWREISWQFVVAIIHSRNLFSNALGILRKVQLTYFIDRHQN